MSDIAITVEEIAAIEPHPYADRLEIAKLLGTQTVVGKGEFKAGDRVVFFPPDMLLPPRASEALGVQKYLKAAMFDGAGKVPCRVAACRLRGVPSYGFVASLLATQPALADPGSGVPCDLGKDATALFGARKYEPPPRISGELAPDCPLFHRYTDIQNYYRYPDAIPLGTPVRITEKIHGINCRVGLVQDDDVWRWIAGSHKTVRKEYDTNGVKSLYWRPLEDEDESLLCLIEHLHYDPLGHSNNVIVFGEIYGPGIQDMYYGIVPGRIGFRVFDISVNGCYLNWHDLGYFTQKWNVPLVPVLYVGPLKPGMIEEYTHGQTCVTSPALLQSKGFTGREGVVITPLEEQYSNVLGGRLILKSISVDYLARKNAEDNK